MFASKEEEHFACWLDELVEKGVVLDYEYEPDPFILLDKKTIEWNKQLKTKVKPTTATLFSEVIYTVDFKVKWSQEASDGLITYNQIGSYPNKPLFYAPSDITYFEVKPNFDSNNMTRAARIKIAWVMHRYGVNIELVKVPRIFKKTFFPQSYLVTDKGDNPRTKTVNGKRIPLTDLDYVNTIEDFAVQEKS